MEHSFSSKEKKKKTFNFKAVEFYIFQFSKTFCYAAVLYLHFAFSLVSRANSTFVRHFNRKYLCYMMNILKSYFLLSSTAIGFALVFMLFLFIIRAWTDVLNIKMIQIALNVHCAMRIV